MKTYLLLRLRIMGKAWRKGKISIRKIANAIHCYLAYWLRLSRSARFPSIIFFELWNECNLRCVACRDQDGNIYDQNKQGDGGPVPKGKMPYEMYSDIMEQVKKNVMLAVLYVNGEPLLYKDLYKAIELASKSKVATMISTNGMPLTDENIDRLLGADVDFIKIAVSGFTQEVYRIYHRNGDIERIKKNLTSLVEKNRTAHGAIIMLDYIVFEHNRHEIDSFRQWAENVGLQMNLRTGISQGQEGLEQIGGGVPVTQTLCDWLWKILVINWNGEAFPCCEYTTWKGATVYGRYETGSSKISRIWNDDAARHYRQIHKQKGRGAIARCVDCHYKGTGPQA